jgi:hypothetical protein
VKRWHSRVWWLVPSLALSTLALSEVRAQPLPGAEELEQPAAPPVAEPPVLADEQPPSEVAPAEPVPDAATQDESKAPAEPPSSEPSLETQLGVGLMADEFDATSAGPAAASAGEPGPVPSLSLMADPSADSAPASSDSPWESRGEVALEARAFLDDHRQDTQDQNVGLFARVMVQGERPHAVLRAKAFARADALDRRRSLVVAEELWAELKTSFVSLRVGADLFNWSATEAFHPADIVNARNLDSDIERYEKLGEPMAELTFRWPSGSVDLFAMPYRMNPVLPSARSRLSPVPEGVRLGKFAYLDDSGRLTTRRFAPQGGLLVRQTVGGADLTLHAVHHTDRSQPEVYFDLARMEPRPLLRTVTQLGGTYQHVMGPVISKLECGYRWFVNPSHRERALDTLKKRDHLLCAVGLEYGFVLGRTESALIAEVESVLLASEEVRKSLQVFQRDALLGYRLSLGDTSASTLSLVGIMDIDDPSQVLVNSSFTRRLGNGFELSLALRLVFGPDETATVSLPSDSDHVRLFLTRYF